MNIQPAGYRRLLGIKQTELAKLFGISVQALRNKEKGITAYNDREKIVFRDLIREKAFPEITIDEIFFKNKVS